MTPEVSASYKGKDIQGRGNFTIRFDGYRLDTLNVKAEIRSQKDCDDLIDFLKVHRYCFIEYKPQQVDNQHHQ